MSSLVVTGTGLVTAAGLGHEALEKALASGQSFVHEQSDGSRCSEVSPALLFWPEEPEWQAMLEYAGMGSQLAVTACHAALGRALREAAAFDPLRGATIIVASDDWTQQPVFDRAIAAAVSPRDEARALFEELEDTFLLRTFRWSTGFAIGSLTGFQGPSVGVDYPSLGGLSGLRHAVDLIDSGEVDAVMLIGVDTRLRLDVSVALERLARDAEQAPLSFGQGAAALLLERSSSAAARGARTLARLLDCRVVFGEESQLTESALSDQVSAHRAFSSSAALGNLFNASALVDICLASEWLSTEAEADRAASACAVASERFGALGLGLAVLDTSAASPGDR